MSPEPSAIRRAAQRLALVRSVVVASGDENLGEMLDDLVVSARRYVRAVVVMEAAACWARAVHAGEPAAFGAAVAPLDKARSSAHNALISRLVGFNRTAGTSLGWEPDGKLPVGGAFSLEPDVLVDPGRNRVRIGDWALLVTLAKAGCEQVQSFTQDPAELLARDPSAYLKVACDSATELCEASRPHDLHQAAAIVAWIFANRARPGTR